MSIESKTKEAILDEVYNKSYDSLDGYSQTTALSAMNQYAAQQNQSLLEALKEMKRYLPILEVAESMPGIWITITRGTGIATLNGYKNAIQNAENQNNNQ